MSGDFGEVDVGCSSPAVNLGKNRFTLSGFIDHVGSLANGMKIALPNDLRYLVNQHRILTDVKNLKERVGSKDHKKIRGGEVRPQRYRPMKTETK